MTKLFGFYRTKQVEVESLAAATAEEYRNLEDGSGGIDGDEVPGSGRGVRRGGEIVGFVAYFATFIGICYVVLGSFYLPPEAGADGGGAIALAGGVILVIAVPVLVGSFAVDCCSGRPRRGVDC